MGFAAAHGKPSYQSLGNTSLVFPPNYSASSSLTVFNIKLARLTTDFTFYNFPRFVIL